MRSLWISSKNKQQQQPLPQKKKKIKRVPCLVHYKISVNLKNTDDVMTLSKSNQLLEYSADYISGKVHENLTSKNRPILHVCLQ